MGAYGRQWEGVDLLGRYPPFLDKAKIPKALAEFFLRLRLTGVRLTTDNDSGNTKRIARIQSKPSW